MSKIANLFLTIAETVKSRSSKAANYFLNIAESMAHKDGAKMKIILPEGDGSIQYKYEATRGDDKTAWGHYYNNAGLFLEQKSQEINPEIKFDKDDVKAVGMQLTDKAKLEPVLNANLANSLWGFAQGSDRQEQLSYIIIGGLAVILAVLMM